MSAGAVGRFRVAYGAHRAAEGRRHEGGELRALPYLATGPLAKQWAVRARTFDAFVDRVLAPMMQRSQAPVRVLDLGAGSGWLCRRMRLAGADAVALDLRDDDVDGLGAARRFGDGDDARFGRVAAAFDALPVRDGAFDVAVFNASLHYALDLRAVLGAARRAVRAGGRIAILDSPFYVTAAHGEAMVAEKRRESAARFGDRVDALSALPFIEYLTRERLAEASSALGVRWRRHRVRYPLWYELRPVVARLRGARQPSRFDLWEGVVG